MRRRMFQNVLTEEISYSCSMTYLYNQSYMAEATSSLVNNKQTRCMTTILHYLHSAAESNAELSLHVTVE